MHIKVKINKKITPLRFFLAITWEVVLGEPHLINDPLL